MRATYLKLIATVFFWGSAFVAGKIAMQAFTPYSAAFLRFLVGAVGLLAICYRENGTLPRLPFKHWLWVVAAAITGSILYNVAFFSGIPHIATVRASLITAFTPAIIAMTSALFFKEKITKTKWLGVAISIVGTVVVISRGNWQAVFSQESWGFGELMILACIVSWTTYTFIGKIAMRQIPVLTLSAYSATLAMIFLSFFALNEGLITQLANARWPSILAVVYIGFTATTLGFVWYFEGVQKLGASKAAVVGNLSPVFAVSIAIIFLGETLIPATIVGGLLVLFGIWLVNKPS